jgi:hypothetical protein
LRQFCRVGMFSFVNSSGQVIDSIYTYFSYVSIVLFFFLGPLRPVISPCGCSCSCQFSAYSKRRFNIGLFQAFYIKAKTNGEEVAINIHSKQRCNERNCTIALEKAFLTAFTMQFCTQHLPTVGSAATSP